MAAFMSRKRSRADEYYQLVQSRRVEGEPRQRVLVHLGKHPTVDDALREWPKEIESLATLLLGSGVHPKLVQELLGHATIATTLDTYSHYLPSMGDQTARAMEDALEKEPAREKGEDNASRG